MSIWRTWEAMHEAATRRVARDCPPCPACGAPGEWDTLDVTPFGGPPEYVRGEHASCTADCWLIDPEKYLAAVRDVPPT